MAKAAKLGITASGEFAGLYRAGLGEKIYETTFVVLLPFHALSPLGIQFKAARPKIYGIAFVRFKAVDLVLTQTDSRDSGSFLDKVGFAASDLPGMRFYLVKHQFRPTPIAHGSNGLSFFEVADPERNRIAFVEASRDESEVQRPRQVSHRLFHAGWIVQNLEVERRFYCDLLGFRLYWYGGFKDTGTDWFEIQVSEGDNRVEFMLNIPAGAHHRELGVQNHFSLGVTDIKATEAKLRANGFRKADKPETALSHGAWECHQILLSRLHGTPSGAMK